MSLTPTLNLTKAITAAIGNIQVQPTPTTVSIKPTPSSVLGTLNAAALALQNIVGLNTIAGVVTRTATPSTSQLLSPFTIPATATSNRIVTSYLVPIRAKPDDVLALSTHKFEPYEQLTGISSERPEIILMMPFKPLFTNDLGQAKSATADIYKSAGIDPYMTDEGLYADAHMQARNLQALNALSAVQRLIASNPVARNHYNLRAVQFRENIASLNNITKFLLTLVKQSEIFKGQLDLRDNIFTVNPQDSARIHSLGVTNSTSHFLADVLSSYAKRWLPPSYTFVDVFTRLGYPSELVSNLYSSSKIWMQLAIEYKQILQYHSLEFLDIEPTAQRNDTNAATFVKPSQSSLFGFSPDDVPGLPTITSLVNLKPADLPTFLPITIRAFQSIYTRGSHFKSDEARIAALAHIISKEQKYSTALASPSVRQALAQHYSYAIVDNSQGNLPLFDSVIGQFGTSITDIAAVEKLSLANLAQQQAITTSTQTSLAVLTFESKYLETTNGTLTPGSTYYVDSLFQTTGQQFNTANLADLTTLLNDASIALTTVVVGMNILGAVDTGLLSQNNSQALSFIANPASWMSLIFKLMLDSSGNTLPVIKNDRLVAIYAMATNNIELKAALFHYTMNSLFRANFQFAIGSTATAPATVGDNTATNDSLIAQILELMKLNTKESRTFLQSLIESQTSGNNANDLDSDVIKAAFKQGTPLTMLMVDLMAQIYTAIDAGTLSGRMRFTGMTNTTVMIAAFDMFLSLVAKFADQRIVSRTLGGSTNSGKVTYVISKTPVNHLNSANEIRTRLNRELTLTQQITYCYFNALKKLRANAQGLLNFFTSPSSVANLQVISKTIGDPNLVQMLMNEQQIMLLGSTVVDLSTKFDGSIATATGPDSKADFGSNEIKILDNSVVSPKLRNAVFGTFGTNEYSGSDAFNKRIISVGIPLGFSRKLKQLVKRNELRNTSFSSKQHDIIQVVVYKVDLINQDIIYKPVRLLFELSRFPVYDDAYYKQLSPNPTFSEIANAIPTRDFEEAFQNATSTVSYWNSTQSSSTAVKSALSSPGYSFLSVTEKASIIRNHLTSQMLEVYVKLMTGIDVSDRNFDIVMPQPPIEPEFVSTMLDQTVQAVINFSKFNVASSPISNSSPVNTVSRTNIMNAPPVGGVLFASTLKVNLPILLSPFTSAFVPTLSNAAGIPGNITPVAQALNITNQNSISPTVTPAAVNLQTISSRRIPNIVQSIKSISSLANMTTSLANGLSVSKRILSPKQFDRVFNICIDPDEFEFDFVKTTATKNGTLALEQMITRGELVPADHAWAPGASGHMFKLPLDVQFKQILSHPTYKGNPNPNLNRFRFRDRNRVEGDLMFEKYFVTIETYGADDV
jgi:hypothetical protein